MADAETGTSADGGKRTTGDAKRAFDFSASDFASIVTTTAYVDKSAMIRDVYNASSRILITAPPRFGKSTNMDMVKRFFEIEVDALGDPKPAHTTNNYKLFKDYNLEIYKDIDFFHEHFGKYPVVYIDFKPLGRVNDSEQILHSFKIIIQNSLGQHSYILQSSRTEQVFSGIAGFSINDFTKRVSGDITEDVDGLYLVNGFKHLSTILERFFEKKVFVLIDSYDAFLDSPVIKNKTDGEKMMSFVKSSVGQLLNNLNCIVRVLLTGVLPVIGEESFSIYIKRYHFLDSHPFTKYYGLTFAEVDTVLSKVVERDEERRDVRNTIEDYYNAYETSDQDVRVYSVWSVLQYVCRRTVQSYWSQLRYVNRFKKCLKMEPIRQKIRQKNRQKIRQKLEELLIRNELQLAISQPLTMVDVFKVNSTITGGDGGHMLAEVELFVALLYHLGYLSVTKEFGRRAVCVNIPNEEIKYELTKVVFDENRELYRSPQMDDILSSLDMFQPDSSDLYENLRKNWEFL